MFTHDTFVFLAENRGRNDRDWFAAHREDYRRLVLLPLTELAEALGPTVAEIDPQIVTEPKIDRTISRIYRDVRFSADKLLYREQAWLSFKRDKKEFPHYPEFFFVMSPQELLYGCGYYSATAAAMDSARAMILAGAPEFYAAAAAAEAAPEFLLDGPRYRRSRYPDRPPELRRWLDCRSICLTRHTTEFTLLYGDALAETLADDFRRLAPVYRFLLTAELRAAAK